MAEKVCMRRSFSNPFESSLDFSQGDPARALGESISFGKYMSETLAWEKWSAFTQNRYLEEAEKYSKPGSVAKMKAYFEAHYGRFGARKHAAQEQESNVSDGVAAQDGPNIEAPLTSLALNRETVPIPTVSSHSSIPESSTEDNRDVDHSRSPTAQLKDSVESVVVTDIIDCLPEVQVHQCQDVAVDSSVTEYPVENNVKDAKQNGTVSTTEERKATVKNEPEQEKPEMEKLNSMSEQKLADYSVKRLKKSNLSKLSPSLSRLSTPVRCKKEANGTPNSKVSKISSSLARLATPVHPRKEGRVTPSNRMLMKETNEKKKLTSSTHHKSINVSSDIDLMKKPSPASRKSGVGKVFTPLGKIIRKSFAPSTTPSRASVNSVLRHPAATPKLETMRSRVALEKSFDRSRRLDQKLKSPSIVNVNSSTQSPASFASFSFRTEERAAKRREVSLNSVLHDPSATPPSDTRGSRVALEKSFDMSRRSEQKLRSPFIANMKSSAPSPVTYASISFRTEERAAKRREFFQKRLEKEAEYMQLIDKAKAKPTPDSRKPSQSRNLEANATACVRTEVLTESTKKIPPPRQPPKFEAKFTYDLARDKSFRPFQRTSGSKPSLENSKTLSGTLMMKKKRHENASPNIL